MQLAQREVAKHKPKSFSQLLLNLLYDGIGLAAIRAFVIAILHQCDFCAFRALGVVFSSDRLLERGHKLLLFRQFLERLQNAVRTGIHANRRAVTPGNRSVLVDYKQSALAYSIGSAINAIL